MRKLIIALVIFLASQEVYAQQLTASWYSRESCAREGTSGIMANGEALNDEKLTCANWSYKFGTVLKVTNLRTGKSVEVVVKDRGPAKKLVRQGRVIDLSYAAMRQLNGIREGVIPVQIEVLK